jgi:uncharacterized membrane protein
MRAIAAAVWVWWVCLGAWFPAGPGWNCALLAVPLAVMLAAAFLVSRGKPLWPASASERIVITAAALLIVNGFCWRGLGLSPRLSFLTALPLVWTAAHLAGAVFSVRFPARPGTDPVIPSPAWRNAPTALALAAFNGWFIAGAILRIRSLSVDYWDMGSIGQAMANFAHGRGFISTDPAGFADWRFAEHCEPLFAALSPVMLWSHGAELMTALQVVAVSLAAVFTGSAMRRITGRRAAYWLGLAGVMLHPAIGFPLWADFHGDVFAVLPLSVLMWALAWGRKGLAWAAFVAAAACIEYALAATSGAGLMLMYLGWKGGDRSAASALIGRGARLLAISVGLFGIGVFALMPLIRSPGALSVMGSHPIADNILNAFSLANLFQALIPFSGALLLSPVALLGAFPMLLKEMLFGMDIGTHHFAPAVPVLFAGLAYIIRDRLPEGRKTQALIQAGFCVFLAAALWGPVPFGAQGWKRLGEWRRLQPVPAGKAERLASLFPSQRNRIVTGSLAGAAFDAPRLDFLGSTYYEPGGHRFPPHSDIVLELWDQGFPAWAPLHRLLKALPFALAGRDSIWTVAASGVLWLPGGGRGENGLDGSLASGPETNRAASKAGAALSALAPGFAMRTGKVYALLAIDRAGYCLPLGLGNRESGWSWFASLPPVGLAPPLRLQLREADSSEETPPIKTWRLRAESAYGTGL